MAKFIIVASPSGCGKDTTVRAIMKDYPRSRKVITTTTRSPRGAEVNGVHYHFVDRHTFLDMINAGVFVEWQDIHGQLYGMQKTELEHSDDYDYNFAVLDVLGAMRYRTMEIEDVEPFLIFLMPPNKEVLRERLRIRNEENEEEIERRMQRYEMEVEMANFFDYIVVNDDLSTTIDNIKRVLLMPV